MQLIYIVFSRIGMYIGNIMRLLWLHTNVHMPDTKIITQSHGVNTDGTANVNQCTFQAIINYSECVYNNCDCRNL